MAEDKSLDPHQEQPVEGDNESVETDDDESLDFSHEQTSAGSDGAGETGDNKSLDFSQEHPSDESKGSTIRIGREYDPRPQEDAARRNIAYLLISLLWVVIAGILILLAFGTIGLPDIKEFSVILGPIVTLVSAATGFYYGTKNNNRN